MAASRIALFPGTFDPFTKGHEDIVRRGLQLFDKVIIALGHNTSKKRYFDVDTMTSKIAGVFEGQAVEVVVYDYLTAQLAQEHGARFLLRGLRNTTDFEYENGIHQMNHHLNPQLETVFLITTAEHAAMRSTIIREVHKLGGDVSPFLPYPL